MTTDNTPLPEQGGFNERLDALFAGYKLHHKDINTCFNDAVAVTHIKQGIFTLILEEIIGEDEYSGQFSTSDPREEYYIGRDELRAEQRKKLGDE